MVTFLEISKTFKVDFWDRSFMALDKVSFEIPEGKITGFLGANGAGKTTLIKILMGFIRQNSGQVSFHSRLGGEREKILSKIGFLPERPYFYAHLTGREFIFYLSRLNDMAPRDISTFLKFWAPLLNIEYALDRKIRTYSKGMLQRLGFITAVIHRPEVIILDEPLSGLDPVGRKEMKDAICEIHRQGKTVFFSSHIIPDVEEICQNVVFLEKGKLVYQGGVEEMLEKNNSCPFRIKAFLAGGQSLKTPFHLLERTEGTLSLEVEENLKDQLVGEIVALGGRIQSLYPVRANLEQVFFDAKKGRLE